jgi:transcriptional regulator with XRE-family HTH domain
MPVASVRTSRQVAELLRAARREHGLSLVAVSEAVGRLGEPIPVSTLARIEKGQFDPGVRRLHALMKVYGISPQAVADLVDIEETTGRLPESDDLGLLYARGLEAWKTGDLRSAFAHFIAIRGQRATTDEERKVREKALVAFATAARSTGRLSLAKRLTEQLLTDGVSPEYEIHLLVLASTVWGDLKSSLAAEAFVGEAERRLRDGDDASRGFVLHAKAKVLHRNGALVEALDALHAARAAFERAGDPLGAANAAITRTLVLEESGDLDGARNSVEAVLQEAIEHKLDRIAAKALVEKGRLVFVSGGDVQAAIELLRQGYARCIACGDRSTEFFAHFWLWKAHAAAGDDANATAERDAARYFVRYVEAETPETKEIRSGPGK